MPSFPTTSAHALARQEPERRWLVEDLWAEGAVGIVGGEPKCCKSFLALDVAVAVGSGRPCLGRFAVQRPGGVLLFAAEDAQHVVRARLEGIALARGTSLEDLAVRVITAPSVRLDIVGDRERLRQTVADLRPRLLVLDPFVRLHRVDENASGEVAPLLAFLRELNREWQLAVLLVHHARKGASAVRGGQALRGTSEFHAWGDSNLYLARRGEALELVVEHRAAPAIAPLRLELAGEESVLALRAVAPSACTVDSSPTSARDRVLEMLREAGQPLRVASLRTLCKMRTQTLVDVLRELVDAGAIEHTLEGYRAVE